MKKKLNCKQCNDCMNKIKSNSEYKPTVSDLAKMFYTVNNISKENFFRTNTREPYILLPRQAFMFLAFVIHNKYYKTNEKRKKHNFSAPKIGAFMGRNHAIVFHSVKNVLNEYQFKYYKKYLELWKEEIEFKTDLRF